jgi:hypothetical protein
LFFIALVMPFYSYYLWPWLCFFATILHGFSCVLLLLLFVMLVVFFLKIAFHSLGHVFLLLLFMALICKMDFSRHVHSQGNEFSRRNNVLDIGSIGNGLLCFYLWFQNPYNINNTH